MTNGMNADGATASSWAVWITAGRNLASSMRTGYREGWTAVLRCVEGFSSCHVAERNSASRNGCREGYLQVRKGWVGYTTT
jgi:hypothetical protein